MLKKLSIIICASAIVTPVLAETFVHEGTTYIYSIGQHRGARVIKGVDATTNRPFEFRVRKGWVEGTVNGNPVSFSQRNVIRINSPKTDVETAAR